MSGERRQPTRSSSDDPQRADRRTWTAARRILLTLVDRVLAEGWLAIRDFESSSSQRPASLTPAPSAVGEGARPLQHPAVVVFETFSLTAVAGTLRRPPPGIYSSSGSAFRVATSFILPIFRHKHFIQHVDDI